MEGLEIRAAGPDDAGELSKLIEKLALLEGEGSAGKVTPKVTPGVLRAEMMDEHPAFECFLGEVGGQVVGYALFFQTFSTQESRCLWLRDIFVEEKNRREGVGEALLRALAEICVERDYSRIDLTVLSTNLPAIAFYKAFGGVIEDKWVLVRVNNEAIQNIAAGAHDSLG